IAGVAIIVIALIVVPDHHQSAGYVFGQTINNSGFHGSGWSSGVFWMVFAIGSIRVGQYTPTGHEAAAHLAEGADQGLAWRGHRDGLVGDRLRDRRVHPPRCGDVRDPQPEGRPDALRRHRHLDLADVDEHALGRGAALHHRRRPVLLPDRMHHVGLADAVRLLARPGRAWPPGLAAHLAPPRAGLLVLRGRPARVPP